ncbi:hypothetical protein BC781_104386 [Sediminitomix flava]|uniref:Lipoprotein n=1 Tax=Sediminitomix flava TaxID=379075 RepID=A0A315Z855_SEDFL|nr:hypothetical protein BC781_104386 [Sediminitomix flava]
MKLKLLVGLLCLLFFGACRTTYRTCPTYSKNTVEKNADNKVSNTTYRNQF